MSYQFHQVVYLLRRIAAALVLLLKILFNFLVSVKAAPNGCVNKTGLL